MPKKLHTMALAFAELLELGEGARRAAGIADALGTVDYIKDKATQMYKRYRKSKFSYRGRMRPKKKARLIKRRKKLAVKRAVGFYPGSGTCKRCIMADNVITANTKTPYSVNLTGIPSTIETGGQFTLNGRDRHIANIRGFKLRFQVTALNPNAWNDFKYIVFYDKFQNENTSINTDMFGDFFRGSTPTSRDTAWDQTTGLWPNHFTLFHRNINVDRIKIIASGRRSIPPREDRQSSPYTKNVSKYVPFKRQLRYQEGDIPFYEHLCSVVG
uniref:Putative capsid protein n=1 Tax=Didemnum sp. Sea Squirt associated virus TaxID=1692247 RepID=A0A0K1RL20_9CIRC|nr:putative capsid protein [Didemnum sp. Sea Squirt associated virus]